MLYGEDVNVTEQGPQIDPRALQALGVEHGSQCWGVWLYDSHPCAGAVDLSCFDQGSPHGKAPHLLISPIHPDSWPVALRLRIELSAEPGSMLQASKVLHAEGWNILFAKCVPTGHYHATWSVICENLNAREEFRREGIDLARARETLLKDLCGACDHNSSVPAWPWEYLFSPPPNTGHCLHEEGKKKLEEHKELEDEVLDKVKRQPELFLRECGKALSDAHHITPFLYQRFVGDQVRGPLGLFADFADGAPDYVTPYRTPYFYGDALPHLILAWLWGRNVMDPLSFKYDERHATIEALEPERFRDTLVRAGVTLPQKTVASFNVEEAFVRIAFAAHRNAPIRVFAVVPYATCAPVNSLLLRAEGDDRCGRDEMCPAPASQEPQESRRSGEAQAPAPDVDDLGDPSWRETSERAVTERGQADDAPPGETSERTDKECCSSCGLLHSLCVRLYKIGVDLLRVSNEITSQSEMEERGNIRITGQFLLPAHSPRWELERWELERSCAETVRQALAEAVGSNGRTIRIDAPLVGPDSADYLFVSVRQKLPRGRDKFMETLRDRAREAGFKDVLDALEPPEGKRLHSFVMEQISRAAAVLQIYSLHPLHADGPLESIRDADIDWLLVENGYATGRGMPVEICADRINGADSTGWSQRIKLQPGCFFHRFNSGDETKRIGKALMEAIWLLRRRVIRQKRNKWEV